jgi:hypothetical protein
VVAGAGDIRIFSFFSERINMARSQKGDSFSDVSGRINNGGQSQKLCSELTTRRSLVIQNQSAGDLFIEFGADAKLGAPSLRIAAGQLFTMEKETGFVDCSDVFIIGATTGQEYAAREGQTWT